VVLGAESMRDARSLLVDLTGDAVLGKEIAGWDDRVDTVTRRVPDAPATALLVRPDGYVAWASSSARPDADALRAALTRWFGAAA
jgi:hypothetical protein